MHWIKTIFLVVELIIEFEVFGEVVMNLDILFDNFCMYNNILLFTKNYPPQIGGIENYSFNLYESLKKEKKTVRIITTYSRNTFLFNNSKKNFLYKQIYITSEIFRLSYFFFKCATIGLYYSFYSDLIW